MLKHRKITLERVEKFTNKIHLGGHFYYKSIDVSIKHWAAPDRVPFTTILDKEFHPIKTGFSLGPLWSTHWLHITYSIPNEWINKGDIFFVFDCQGEALIYSKNGKPIHSLNGQLGEDRRERFKLYPSCHYNELQGEFYVECACNELFGNSNWEVGPTPPDINREYSIKICNLSLILPSFWKLYHDYVLIAEIAKEQYEDSWESCEALKIANNMINVCDLSNPETFPIASKIAEDYFNDKRGFNSGFHLYAIGHCHIDTAWLWPIAETKRKCARSWSTQLSLIKRYPKYKFACSQAQQYAWVRKDYPSLFKEIQQSVSKGNFIPVGGTFVEMDCNIPSGESLVRQFLYGQRFFNKYFDCPSSPIFWLPDTFGYAAQLPQIIKKSGMKYFLTQKLSWNQVNKFPHNTFIWEGIDGSRVLTHFPPADNYCSHANIADIIKSERNFKDKERSNCASLVFGMGDGGGGTIESHLERLQRIESHSFGGIPSVSFESPVSFFEEIEKNMDNYCVWNGELYFEYHRGTYTTQAKNKLYNRRTEELMREIEMISCISSLLHNDSYNFKIIRKLWKLILVNQFHDIIPGTSIHCVYEDSTKDYNNVFKQGNSIRNQIIEIITQSKIILDSYNTWMLINPLCFNRTEIIELHPSISHENIQVHDKYSLGIISISPCGYAIQDKSCFISSKDSVSINKDKNGYFIKNKWISVNIDFTGHITSYIWNNNGRQIIKANHFANHFILFDDNPLFWDAWDVDAYHLEKPFEFHNSNNDNITSKIIENGPIRTSIEFYIPISKDSFIKQIIKVNCLNPMIEFDSTIEWHESHKFLKVQFPLNIRSPQCSFEIPYGYVERPTHFNTSWDVARFEVCAHRWADLSEYNFGVALLNDCKYGYSTHGSIMSLSLLRSPKAPDESADMGLHSFRYAILPHEESFQKANIVQKALAFNSPFTCHYINSKLTNSYSFVNFNADGIILDQIKQKEDSKDLILRFYEAHGGSQLNCKISLTEKVKSVKLVNLLEDTIPNNIIDLNDNDNSFLLNFSPFEIITVKVLY